MYLVTLEQAKIHLRMNVDETAYDDDLTQKVEDASEIVLDYLKLETAPTGWEVDPGDSPQIASAPRVIQAAVLLVLGELNKNREGSAIELLSPGVIHLLDRQRDPTLA